jgi:hypothetical protein
VVFTLSATARTAPSVAAAAKREAVHQVPRAIKKDCSRDVTAALATWIASVPDGSTLSFAKRGCYRIDETLAITNRQNLTFAGNGATLQAETEGDQGRRHLVFTGGGGIAIHDLTIRGANHAASATSAPYVAEKESQHAFSFQGVNGASLDHVRAFGVYGDFVYIGVGKDGRTWSKDVSVTNSEFVGSGRQGISVIAATNVLIDHNTIEGVARSMFDIEPNAARDGAVHVRITGNHTGLANNFFLASKGNGGGTISDITVTDNLADAATGNVMWVAGSGAKSRGPFVIERNLFHLRGTAHDSNSQGAFYFSRCTDVTVQANVAVFPEGQNIPAVEIRNSQQVTVQDNVFTNAGQTVLNTGASAQPAATP